MFETIKTTYYLVLFHENHEFKFRANLQACIAIQNSKRRSSATAVTL